MRPKFQPSWTVRFRTHTYTLTNRHLFSISWITLFILVLSFHAKAQCDVDDIEVTTTQTWSDRDVQMTEDQKIIVTSGATLTMERCIVRRKVGCSGYWDGIYLVIDENGNKAGLVLTEGTRIEFSKRGIQAVGGFSQITLDEAEMSDNGQMIRAWDNWPFAPIGFEGEGGFASNSNNNRGDIISPYDIACDGEIPPPPKVTIRNNSILKVFENGNLSINPPKYQSQINTLGGALDIKDSEIYDGTNLPIIAVASSRGKCRIMNRTRINGFYIGVYKGSDASANCVSEGLELTYSLITDTDLFVSFGNIDFFNKPGFSVYNISSNVLMKRNILESNIWSMGASYGQIIENNIYNGHDPDVDQVSVYIQNPQQSFNIFDNGLTEMPLEFIGNNHRTNVTCNTIIDETNGVVAGGDNTFPLSWGTSSKSAGNVWKNTQSYMYNLSGVDLDMRYYYLDFIPSEVFYWADGFTEVPTTFADTSCSYFWPANALALDPDEYEVSIEDLEDQYEDTQDAIDYIIGHLDTTVLSVKEEMWALKNKLNDLVGQGFLFHTTSSTEFWNSELDPRVEELLGLNYLWYGQYMESVADDLESNTDPDAEALYDATIKVMDFFDNGKNIYTFTNLQVDTLQTIAESSYGDYTNILRNYLFMVYDIFIPFEREDTGLDDLRSPVQRPVDQPVYTTLDFTISPNPFTDDISIKRSNFKNTGNTSYVSVYNTDGKLVSSTIYTGNSAQLNLDDLEPGFYILKIKDSGSGKIEVKQILKGWK